jgi:hypothetical protein
MLSLSTPKREAAADMILQIPDADWKSRLYSSYSLRQTLMMIIPHVR